MVSVRETWTVPLGAVPSGSMTVDVALHPSRAGRIVFVLPGYDGDVDGYGEKYRKIADLLQDRGVGAVVRMGNHPLDDAEFEDSSAAQLRGVVARAISMASELAGAPLPELLFMGFSAGASTMAALAGEFPALTTILLVAPSSDAGEPAVRAGLASFGGRLHVAVGEHDLVVGRRFPEAVATWAPRAVSKLAVIPRCDHQFTGATNGRILSQAALWAFAGDEPFPDAGRGIHLYD